MKNLVIVLAAGAALSFGACVPAAADPNTPSLGQFCTKAQEGKTANAGDGAALICAAGSDGRTRWTTSTDAAGVGAGKFCTKDQEGKTAASSDGASLVCAKGSDGRDRWTKK